MSVISQRNGLLQCFLMIWNTISYNIFYFPMFNVLIAYKNMEPVLYQRMENYDPGCSLPFMAL